MAATQPAYEYSAYDYPYDTSSSSAYPSYSGYESNTSYAAPGTYDGYPTSAAYHTGAPPGPPYTTVDPYSEYPPAAYSYSSAPVAGGAPSATSSQAAYSYSPSPSSSIYAYDSRHSTPPSSSPSASSVHYAPYDYSSTVGYSPYKTAPDTNGSSSSSAYPAYATSAPPTHVAYGVPPGSHLAGTMGPPPHIYGPPAAGMIPRRQDYYSSVQAPHPMHYQPQSMPYRLPPRGGYQRELDEPGDENALLRHVVYIVGLPKEIQNETLAEVFGSACGPIAPVDVRSPKLKIWVYKDRQTREGKGEATITFINPESCQTAINYFNGKELFGREIRVNLCPRRLYNMQKQNTPFNPAAPLVNTTTPISSMIKTTNNGVPTTTTTTTTTNATTPLSSNIVSGANPIATISSSTLGLPRQLNHSLFKFRQTPDQQRGLLPTPPVPFGAPIAGSALHRDGVRKELPRIALNRGNYANPAGIRPKPY